MRILVSACLLGCACRYDGQSKPRQEILALAEKHELVPVCPEQSGGLPTPRPPAEIRGGHVVRRDGADVTREYLRGADEAARLCALLRCEAAILKARSPSCGTGAVYDGTFTGRLTEGDGITARLLREMGVRVWNEEDFTEAELQEASRERREKDEIRGGV